MGDYGVSCSFQEFLQYKDRKKVAIAIPRKVILFWLGLESGRLKFRVPVCSSELLLHLLDYFGWGGRRGSQSEGKADILQTQLLLLASRKRKMLELYKIFSFRNSLPKLLFLSIFHGTVEKWRRT